MATFYTPKYLKAEELVSRAFFTRIQKSVGAERVFWQFNPYVLMTADLLRERFGSITVNNWSSGGSFNLRGLRSDSDSVGAPFGPHKRGAALDCNFANATAEEVREVMRKAGCFNAGFKNKSKFGADECFRYIGRVELTEGGKKISWFHFDIWNNQAQDGSVLGFNA